MWNKCKVIMLPTNEKAKMYIKGTLKLGSDEVHSTGQHLYILSDKEIKEGNWYENNGVIFKADDKFDEGNNPNQNKNNKKIIATTDKSLGLNSLQKAILNNSAYESIKPKGLPQIPQSFIEHFVSEYNKGNIITEVMVEYEGDYDVYYKAYYAETIVLKVNSKDNTINIKPIKDSWSRKEVENLLRSFRTDILPFGQVNDFTLNKWIEKNL